MLCCCERDEQTASRMMSDYNIDLGEQGVSSVPALMAKIVGHKFFCSHLRIDTSRVYVVVLVCIGKVHCTLDN